MVLLQRMNAEEDPANQGLHGKTVVEMEMMVPVLAKCSGRAGLRCTAIDDANQLVINCNSW